MVNVRLITDIPKLLDSGGVTGQYLYKATSTAIGFDSINYSDIIGYPSTPADSDFVKSIINTDILSPLVDPAVYSISTYLNSGIGSNILKESSGVTVKLGNYSKGISNLYLDSSSTITIGSHSFSLASNGEVSFFGGSASSSYGISSGSSSAVVIQNSNYTSFLLKTDSTQTDAQVDASTNAFTITESGNVTSTAFTPYHPQGYSTYFDNSGDYLITESTSNVTIGSGDFTCELWWYPTNTMGQYNKLITTGTSSNCFSIEAQSAGLTLSITDYSSTVFGTANTALNQNEWNHIAVVRSSGTMKMYQNGTEVLSVSNSTNFTGTYVQAGWSSGVQGNVRDVRLVVGTAVYTSAFSPPTEPLTAIANTKLLMCHLPYIADGSSNNLSITSYGDTKTEQFTPYDSVAYSPSSHGGSVYFDGSGDYLSVADDASLEVGSGDFTLEGWFYLETTGYGVIVSKTSSAYAPYWVNVNNRVMYFYASSGNTSWDVSNGNTFGTADLNSWNHFAVSRSGNSIRLFLNGVLGNTVTSSATLTDHTDPFTIAAQYNGVNPFTGFVSDIRLVKGTAVYTADFTPPTEPLTAIAGTQLLTCTNKNNIYDAAGGNLLTVVGDTTTNTSTVNYSSSSIYFDGGGDYIKLNGSFSDFFDGPFTIEFFVNLTNATSSSVISLGDGSGVDGMYLLHGGYGCYLGTNGSWNLISGSVTGMTTGTWHHFALTWDGSDYRIFVDGALELSATSSTKIGPGGGYTLAIGATYTGVQPTTGYVEDVRFTKGLARYTSAFTPPTAALEG